MARVIGIGNQDFEKVRVNNNFYIDKTALIREARKSAYGSMGLLSAGRRC